MFGWHKAIHVTMRDKDFGVLVDNKLTLSQQCPLGVKKDNDVLGYIRKSLAIRWRRLILPLLSLLLEYGVHSWALQHIRDMELLSESSREGSEED